MAGQVYCESQGLIGGYSRAASRQLVSFLTLLRSHGRGDLVARRVVTRLDSAL